MYVSGTPGCGRDHMRSVSSMIDRYGDVGCYLAEVSDEGHDGDTKIDMEAGYIYVNLTYIRHA
jgi:hypothetical protein